MVISCDIHSQESCCMHVVGSLSLSVFCSYETIEHYVIVFVFFIENCKHAQWRIRTELNKEWERKGYGYYGKSKHRKKNWDNMQVALVEQDEVSKKNTARRIEMETSLSTTNKATPGVEAKFDHKHYNDFMWTAACAEISASEMKISGMNGQSGPPGWKTSKWIT